MKSALKKEEAVMQKRRLQQLARIEEMKKEEELRRSIEQVTRIKRREMVQLLGELGVGVYKGHLNQVRQGTVRGKQFSEYFS